MRLWHLPPFVLEGTGESAINAFRGCFLQVRHCHTSYIHYRYQPAFLWTIFQERRPLFQHESWGHTHPMTRLLLCPWFDATIRDVQSQPRVYCATVLRRVSLSFVTISADPGVKTWLLTKIFDTPTSEKAQHNSLLYYRLCPFPAPERTKRGRDSCMAMHCGGHPAVDKLQ